MTEKLNEMAWLHAGKAHLLRLRQQWWLTESDVAIVDRGITALELLAIGDANESSQGLLAHFHTSNFKQGQTI